MEHTGRTFQPYPFSKHGAFRSKESIKLFKRVDSGFSCFRYPNVNRPHIRATVSLTASA